MIDRLGRKAHPGDSSLKRLEEGGLFRRMRFSLLRGTNAGAGGIRAEMGIEEPRHAQHG
jgi:hypothetical protein